MSRVQVLYTDVDGTLVGPGGCFFRAEDRSLTLEPARALLELHEAGITIVLVSGRTRAQLVEACLLLGADGYVAELGAIVGWDRARQLQVLRGEVPDGVPGSGRAPDELVDGLMAAFPGRLELHDPWHLGHEVDVMLRGQVDLDAAEAWLAEQGFGWLRLYDNGVLPPNRPVRLSPDAYPVHVYHLLPAGISKGRGVAADLARRGLTAADAVAVGDSVSDLDMAPHVSHMWLVANGVARHPGAAALAGTLDNVSVTDQAVGLGWATAVRAALARTRGAHSDLR